MTSKKYLILIIVTITAIFAALSTGAQTPQPDLIVRAASITKDPTGLFVDKIRVAVSTGARARPPANRTSL